MVDVARLGLAVDSSQVEKGTATLHQLTGAAGQASAAAQRLAGATNVEAAGHKAAAAAAQVHNAALMAQNTVIRSSMQQRTMMIYQLNDVAVSLASGMNPAMVAMQQGSQILQGGFAPALRTITDLVGGLVTKFWPLGLAIGAVTGLLAGMTYEFNKSAETQVSMLDVAQAAWELFAEGVAAEVQPVFAAIGSWLQAGWDAAAPVLKAMGNAIIGTSNAISIVWATWPAVMGEAIISTVNVALTGITRLLNESRVQVLQFLSWVSTLPIPGVSNLATAALGMGSKPFEAPQFANPYAGTTGAVGGAISDAMGKDYLGEAGAAWSRRAQQIANRPDEDALKAGAKEAERQKEAYDDLVRSAQQRIAQSEMEVATIGMTAVEMGRLRHEQELLNKAANDNIALTPKQTEEIGALAQAMSVAEEAARRAKEMFDFSKGIVKGFLSDLRQGLNDGASFWEAFGNAGMNVLDKIIDKIETNLVDALFSMGGGGGGGIFGFLGGLLGFANGGVFNAGHQVQAFAQGGIVSKPTLFPMANGAGLMGEAGPEAIMPLRRGSDGKLGVAAANQNQAQAMHITLGWARGSNGNIAPIIESVSQQTVAGAAPGIVGAAVSQSNKAAPASVARYQKDIAGGDYRLA